ncbi:MAG: MBL fold metallo-hydrolase [bacterium]|nr:MBL fold metallo-hydrolase [bacterium]
MKYSLLLPILFFLLNACSDASRNSEKEGQAELFVERTTPLLVVLGTIQDAGSPQIGCKKECCKDLFTNPDPDRMVVSLGVSDSEGRNYIFDASPDLPRQFELLRKVSKRTPNNAPDGIFLTHAHIGHYTGLMYLGKEAMDANQVPVFAMPRMEQFLQENGPWSLLVERKNIKIQALQDGESIDLGEISVTPILVPHRDEFSETVGYRIEGPNKSALFIPDIDKWTKWEKDIIEEVKKVDFAFLDATFFSGEEINNRDISQIPHPFVVESLKAFQNLDAKEKSKIHFIHFNHTNPIINPNSEEAKRVRKAGFNIAQLRQTFFL